MFGRDSVPRASEACCPTYYAMRTIGSSDKSQLNYRNLRHDRDLHSDLLFEKNLS